MPPLSIDESTLPDITQPSMDFLDSSFFRQHQHKTRVLMSPAEIIRKYGRHGQEVIMLDDPPMAVKIHHVERFRLEEIQTMVAMRSIFPVGDIIVPEVFGYRHHDGMIHVYMSVMPGITLRQAWPTLTAVDKSNIQSDLRRVISTLRSIVPRTPKQICQSSLFMPFPQPLEQTHEETC